jgi:vitamin B12 transporter
MKQKYISMALLSAAILPISCFAEIPNLDEVVITATRIPQPLSKTIADTTVLNEQEIRDSGAQDAPALLRSLAGLEVAQSGGLGAQSGTYLRGTNSNQVLVLIDGVRVNSATAGATALEHIMLDNIERIEVVRGNVSSLYGSEAIGGVIQIFTRHGSGTPALTASMGGGTHGTQRYVAGFSGEVGSTSFSVNASKNKTDGLSAINPRIVPNANPNNNGYVNNSFNAQVKHAFNADHAVTASWFSTRSNISFDSPYGLPTDLYNSQDNIEKVSLASDDQINETWHSQVRIAQGADDSQTYGGYTSRYKTQSKQYAWQNNLEFAEGQKLTLAVENLGQTVSSDTQFTQTTRNVNSFLGGYTGDYGKHQIQLNLRQDNYSDFGSVNTGLLGYGFAFAESWRATGSLSNAFKAPTFNDMYDPFSGNPNVRPERSQNKEAGVHYAASGHRIDAVYFDNRIADFIELDSSYVATNTPLAEIVGQVLSYTGDFGNKHLKANMTFQNPRDTSTGLILARRAKEFASISASHDLGEWNMGAEFRYSGARQDNNTSTSPTLPGYSRVNLTTRYTFDRHYNLSARVDNLFNASYSEAYGYNTSGRTLFIGVNYQ